VLVPTFAGARGNTNDHVLVDVDRPEHYAAWTKEERAKAPARR